MAEAKTKPTTADVNAFLQAIGDESTREDCLTLLKIMKQATRAEPILWGSNIVGFGTYHYQYATGREGDWPLTAFSPRKQNLTIYIMPGFDRYEDLMARLGKHKTGKSCLYIKRLADIDLKVLKELITASVKHMKQTYPSS